MFKSTVTKIAGKLLSNEKLEEAVMSHVDSYLDSYVDFLKAGTKAIVRAGFNSGRRNKDAILELAGAMDQIQSALEKFDFESFQEELEKNEEVPELLTKFVSRYEEGYKKIAEEFNKGGEE